MGVGYTRKDTSNLINNGETVDATVLDLELDGLEDAFDATTGHTHDGTSAEGGPITFVGPGQDVEVTAGAVLPKTDNTLDLGSSTREFKDLFIDGTANIDSLVADTADINGGTVDGAVIGGTTPAAGTFTTVNGTTITAFTRFLGPITGAVTGNVTGNLTGNVTGDVTGDVTGNVTGDLTGNVTGNVTGNLTGNVTGNVSGNAGTVTNGVYTSRTIFPGAGLTGGGDLSANRTISMAGMNAGTFKGRKTSSGNGDPQDLTPSQLVDEIRANLDLEYAAVNDVVYLTGAQTVAGIKTFTNAPRVDTGPFNVLGFGAATDNQRGSLIHDDSNGVTYFEVRDISGSTNYYTFAPPAVAQNNESVLNRFQADARYQRIGAGQIVGGGFVSTGGTLSGNYGIVSSGARSGIFTGVYNITLNGTVSAFHVMVSCAETNPFFLSATDLTSFNITIRSWNSSGSAAWSGFMFSVIRA